MIELIVLDYLNEVLDVNAYMEEQTDSESSYIIIEKTGGGETNYIRSATIAIQSYGSTMYQAASLNETVKDAMRNIITLSTVSSCKLNSDYNYTDTTKKKYRYQAVYDMVYYPYTVTISESTYLADEEGNMPTDEEGNYLII